MPVLIAVLDCIQKLVAQGYLRGVSVNAYDNASTSSAGKAPSMQTLESDGSAQQVKFTNMDVVVGLVCQCKDVLHDEVHLQVWSLLGSP